MQTPYPLLSRPVALNRHSCQMHDYRYELRSGDEIIATGHLAQEQPLEVGQQLEIGGQLGIIRTIDPLLHQPEQRLVVQLLRQR